jgi:hypothetical protein
VGSCAAASSLLSLAQSALMDRKIAAVTLQPPIFVIGHWRSGTTLLHELLAQDQQFTYPTTFQCFVPNHFLVSRWFLEPLVRLLLPAKRPMDAMPTGARLPQEDEFALLGMGAPTPYRHIAFCNEPAPYQEMLNFDDADPRDVEKIRQSLTWFYKSITCQTSGRRLVVKSPTHTGRIAELAKWFPGAKFIHISRHPHKIFPSTAHLWRSLAAVQGYQYPRDNDPSLEEYVHRCYERMYDGYFQHRHELPPDSLMEVRFEDLVRDPLDVVRRVYDSFQLPGFQEVLPRLETFWSDRQSHQKNSTQVDDTARDEIDNRWSRYMQEFGYQLEPALNS